jgi:flagellar basal-body rod protein FlgF
MNRRRAHPRRDRLCAFGYSERAVNKWLLPERFPRPPAGGNICPAIAAASGRPCPHTPPGGSAQAIENAEDTRWHGACTQGGRDGRRDLAARPTEPGMENTTFIVLSQQMALRRQMDVIANNIANTGTNGFKAGRMLFASYLQNVGRSERAAFVQDIAVALDPRDGEITTTNNPLDLAIQGEGFFKVETPDGIRYTRGGHFRLDDQGTLVTSEGDPLLGDDDFPIVTSPGDAALNIASDGTVEQDDIIIGRIDVVTFENVLALRKVRAGLYDTTLQPIPADSARVVQGAVERSNVEPIVEMTRMISLLRSYQGAQRLAQEQNQIRRRAITVLAGTSQSA